MAKYRISQKAIADLGGIWKYTAETWSEEQADSSVWIDRILHEKMDFQRQFFVPAGSVSKYIETWPKYASRIFSQ